MSRARRKESSYDVIFDMRKEGKKGKIDSSPPIHDPSNHKLFCVWLPATRKFVSWDKNGNPVYTSAFDDLLKANPQDLRLQSGYQLLEHRGVWRIYFLFTCQSDVRAFVSNIDVNVFRLTEKIPNMRGRWDPKDLDNIFRLESYPSFLSKKAIPDDADLVEFLNKHMVPKAFPHAVFPVSIIRVRRQKFSIELEFSRDLSESDVKALREVEIEGNKFSVHGVFGNRFYSCCSEICYNALQLLFEL